MGVLFCAAHANERRAGQWTLINLMMRISARKRIGAADPVAVPDAPPLQPFQVVPIPSIMEPVSHTTHEGINILEDISRWYFQ